MIMEKLGKGISKVPKTCIIVIIIITLLLGATYFVKGTKTDGGHAGYATKMEATKETYLPDNELVNAELEIERDYGTINSVQILVKSKDSVLRNESLIEMLRVEKGFLEDAEINSTLVSEINPERVICVADAIYLGKMLFELIDDLNESFNTMNNSFYYLSSQLENYMGYIDLFELLPIDQLNAVIIELNKSLIANFTQFSQISTLSEMTTFENLMFLPVIPVDAKLENMSVMSDLEVRELIVNITHYNNSKTETLNETIHGFGMILSYAQRWITTLNTNLTNLSNLNISSEAEVALQNIISLLQQLSEMIHSISSFVQNFDVKTFDSNIALINRSMSMILTTDFTAEHLEAKGTVMILLFNSSNLPGENDKAKSDRFLKLENRMVAIIKAQNLTTADMDVMGAELIQNEIVTASEKSIEILIPTAFILVFIILIITYRMILDVVFSGLALGFAVIWVYGIGTLAGFVFNPMTIAAPVIIIGIGIAYAIYLTLRYREEVRKGRTPKDASKATLKYLGTAIMLCVFTTMVAFLSNLSSDMRVIREFGILVAVGILSSFVISILFIPSCEQLVDEYKLKKGKKILKNMNLSESPLSKWDKIKRIFNKGLSAGAVGATHHPMIVLSIVLIITGASIGLGLHLGAEFDLNDFLPEELEVTQNINYLTNNFNFSMETASILVKGDMTNTTVLKAMDDTINNMNNDIYVTKNVDGKADVTSILSIMKDVADDNRLGTPMDLYSDEFKLVYENSIGADGIPARNITTLYDLLYADKNTTDTVKTVLHRAEDGTYDGSVIRIKVDTEDRKKAKELYAELKEDNKPLNTLVANGALKGSTVTGLSILIYVITDTLSKSMLSSLIITILFSLIALTIIFYFNRRSLLLGIITMIPVLLGVPWILGSMFLLNIPFNVLTITVSALTIGLGVDYGIQITYRFLEEFDKSENVDAACRNCVSNTGIAIFAAATTTIAAFGILIFALLPPMRLFGTIVALTIMYAFIATIFILPISLTLWAKRAKKKIIKV